MRKLIAGILAASLVFSMGSMTAFAAQTAPAAHYYVDNNGDGICDTCGISCAFVDVNGDGICDNYGTHSLCVGSHGCGYAAANTTGYGYGGHCGGGGYYRSGGHHGRGHH